VEATATADAADAVAAQLAEEERYAAQLEARISTPPAVGGPPPFQRCD
jgi:hypothetical protein